MSLGILTATSAALHNMSIISSRQSLCKQGEVNASVFSSGQFHLLLLLHASLHASKKSTALAMYRAVRCSS